MLKKRIGAFALAFMILSSGISMPVHAAETVTTPIESIAKNTKVNKYKMTVNVANNKKRTYTVYYQKNPSYGKKSYIPLHGCAACSLATVLSGYSKKYGDYTPTKIYKTYEKKVFGTKTWNKNYRKSMSKQMPVSLNGISKALNYAGISNKYVRTFKDKTAMKQIENHLLTGRPVIIEVNNHKQKNGVFSKKYSQKWALGKHTMVLLGMTDTGKVIVADSANRTWSGNNQRIKFAKMDELIQYMIPCKSYSKSYYYTSYTASGGYILVTK